MVDIKLCFQRHDFNGKVQKYLEGINITIQAWRDFFHVREPVPGQVGKNHRICDTTGISSALDHSPYTYFVCSTP